MFIDQIDEVADVLVLPAGAPLVHGIAEGEPRVGIGKPQRAAGTEVPERTRARAQASLGHGELESEPEARGALQDHILGVHLLRDRHRDDLAGEDVHAVELAVAGERRVEPRHPARIPVAVRRRHFRRAPSPCVDDPRP